MLIEHVDAIVDLRRNRTLVHGTVLGKGQEVLANLRETGTMGGYDTAARYDWSVDLNAPIAQAGGFHFSADAVADMTRAKIVDGPYVPRIPPLRIRGGLEASGERIDARAEVEWTDDQTRIAPFETSTKGFTLVNASLTWRPLPDTKNLSLTLAANNIFDVDARRHASFTKDYVPLAGRDFRLTARASF